MITNRLTYCPTSPNILSLIKDIDCKILSISNSLYNNTIYMLNQQIPGEVIIDLMNYKRILICKYCNPDYLCDYSVTIIASKVKRLTLGVTCRNCDDVV